MNGHFIYRNKGDVLIRACFRCAAHLVYEVLQMPELVDYVSPQKIRFALLSMRWVCVVALTNPTPKFISNFTDLREKKSDEVGSQVEALQHPVIQACPADAPPAAGITVMWESATSRTLLK